MCRVLQALRTNFLYASRKKTLLFAFKLNFLGHHIPARGIEADNKKVEKVLSWPMPRSATNIRGFLGLVCYLDKFLPKFAKYTCVLTPLTTKDAEKSWPGWTATHEDTFEAIKKLVVSHECLMVIDYQNMGNNRIFIQLDSSDWRTGAVLLYGPSLADARPVVYDFLQLKPAKMNYPTYEKELLAIVCAFSHWRTDPLIMHFEVYTDHRLLTQFMKQKNLSQRQVHWQELMRQYSFDIKYIPSEENSLADSLSRLLPDPPELSVVIAVSTLHISSDPSWLKTIRKGYAGDS